MRRDVEEIRSDYGHRGRRTAFVLGTEYKAIQDLLGAYDELKAELEAFKAREHQAIMERGCVCVRCAYHAKQ